MPGATTTDSPEPEIPDSSHTTSSKKKKKAASSSASSSKSSSSKSSSAKSKHKKATGLEDTVTEGEKLTTGLKDALTAMSDEDGFLFGHHMTTYSGQYFTDTDAINDNSDVKNATGKFPLVYGFDFAKVIDDKGDFVAHVKAAYKRGGVMSFMWLTPNPLNGQDSYNKTGNPCVELQAHGKANAQWLSYLDTISDFLEEIYPIPVVFRLFHEMTGWWYWWGTHTCATEDFIDAWQYTVDYLKETKGNDNLLMFYATSRIASDFTKYEQANVTAAMTANYPGGEISY